MAGLSNEGLKQLVSTTIQLSELLKTKRKEIKRIRDTYKAVCDRIKSHATQNNISYIDMAGYQLHVYTQTREPALNEAFLKDNLKEFFVSSGHQQGTPMAADAATYVLQRKKAKTGGKQALVLALKKLKINTAKESATLVLNDDDASSSSGAPPIAKRSSKPLAAQPQQQSTVVVPVNL